MLTEPLVDHSELANQESVGVGWQQDKIKARAKVDLNFLAALCLPTVCKANFPDEYIHVWELLTGALIADRDFSKFALGLPRGHAKTTFLKILIIWVILFTKRKFPLIVCASVGLAINVVKDIADILDSPNIIKIFGNWRDHLETDQADTKIFNFQGRPVILKGIGTGGTLRGLNVKNSRPDFIACDDMQTKEEALSDIVSKNLLGWLVGTLMKTKAPTGCTILYIGNMYRDIKIGGVNSNLFTCILRNLQNNPSWVSWIVGAILIDDDGEPTALWEEVQPLEQLMNELENDTLLGCADVFYSEVLNDPSCGTGDHFDLSKMPVYDIDEDMDLKLGSFILIDPSLGRKKSDAQVVGYFEVFENTVKDVSFPTDVLKEIHIKQVPAPELVEFVLDLAVKKDCNLVVAESVAYQGTLLQWFEKISKDKDIEGIDFLPISPAGRKKNNRIIDWLKRLMGGRSKVHPNTLAVVLSQISSFDPLSQSNTDDILDVGAYGGDVLLEYPSELMSKDIFDLSSGDYQVLEDNCVF